MNYFKKLTEQYLTFCQFQKRLDAKTIKAYQIDLKQFQQQMSITTVTQLTSEILESYLSTLHQNYQPKTAKRKIASLKAFFHYLVQKDFITTNPMDKIQTKFREPITLPRTIPLHMIETLLATMYHQRELAETEFQKKSTLRDIAVTELLFSTGMRISELCSLQPSDIDLHEGVILIHGKGAKERKIQIVNQDILSILKEYQQWHYLEISNCHYFFVNRLKKRLSEQSVREMINKYASIAGIHLHITPHMFRHSFATYLLESDVDIRYIQKMLGHSSINITEIYTHVAMSKQKDILMTKHPRRNFTL